MTQQAIKLGYLPRMSIQHTSSKTMGQIYVPMVNWILLVAVVLAVVGFGSSTRLASAYGVAVMGTMLITTLLTFVVIRHTWRYPVWFCVIATGFFLLIDVTFLAAALHKVLEGGWFPLLAGSAIFCVMMIWWRGRRTLVERLNTSSIPLRAFLDSLFRSPPYRVPGTAVFLNSALDGVPHALLHSLEHYNVLHECNVFLTVQFLEVPWVKFENRVHCEKLGHDCWLVSVRYGFMNRPDVGAALELCGPTGLQLDPQQVSYFLSREKIVPSGTTNGMGRVGQLLFAAMARNAGSITDFFNIPTNRVVELGTRIQL